MGYFAKKLNIDSEVFDRKLEKLQKWEKTLFGKIHDFYDKIIGWKINNFITGIQRLFIWFPVIWHDRDWDDSYLFAILKKKLQIMVVYYEKKQFHEGWEDDVRYMKLCIKLIEYEMEEHYESLIWDEITKKWGDSKIISTQIPKDELSKELGEKGPLYSITIKYEKVVTEEDEKNHQKDVLDGCQWAYQQQDKATKLLFRILYEKIRGWWI